MSILIITMYKATNTSKNDKNDCGVDRIDRASTEFSKIIS